MNAGAFGRGRTMRRGRTIALVTLLVGLPLATPAPLRAQTRVDPRHHMLVLTNHDRELRDRRALALTAGLSRYATAHSREMARRGYVFHSSSARLQQVLAAYDWSIGGENVGVGTSLRSLERAFMRSREHRRNILRTGFDHAAFGVYREDGAVWVTVIFYG